MLREQGAKEKMWRYDGVKFVVLDITANVFRRTT
jgi:hypothetical protein